MHRLHTGNLDHLYILDGTNKSLKYLLCVNYICYFFSLRQGKLIYIYLKKSCVCGKTLTCIFCIPSFKKMHCLHEWHVFACNEKVVQT